MGLNRVTWGGWRQETGERNRVTWGAWRQETLVTSPPTTRLKRWTGSTWEPVVLKVWGGSAWVEKPIKVYTLSGWL